MKNSLSVKSYIEQKPNKEDCKKIALAICKAVKQSWEEFAFSVDGLDVGVNPELGALHGYALHFMLQDKEKSEEFNSPDELIKYIEKDHNSLPVTVIHDYTNAHNISWALIEKYVYANISDYLDLSYMQLISRYTKLDKLDDYFYADGDKYSAERKKDIEAGGTPKEKGCVSVSSIYEPESPSDSNPFVAITLITVPKKTITKYISQDY